MMLITLIMLSTMFLCLVVVVNGPQSIFNRRSNITKWIDIKACIHNSYYYRTFIFLPKQCDVWEMMCTFIIDRSVCSSTALGNNLTFPPIRSKTITFKCNSLLIANAVIVDHFLLKLSVIIVLFLFLLLLLLFHLEALEIEVIFITRVKCYTSTFEYMRNFSRSSIFQFKSILFGSTTVQFKN